MNAIAERLKRSWELFRSSVRVIRDYPKLLFFPLLTGLLTLGIAMFFLLPVALVLLVPEWQNAAHWKPVVAWLGFIQNTEAAGGQAHVQLSPLGMAIAAVFYLASMFLATFFNVAFNSEILVALNGRPVSIRHGFAVAFSRVQSILYWSLLAGVVGLIIRSLEERFSIIGRLIAGLIGLAWSVTSIFVIPILVRDTSTANPIKILTKSARTIKQTWGEMLVGYVGLQGANAIVAWLSLCYWLITGVITYLVYNPWVLLPAGVLWLLFIFAYAYLAGIASKVYLCALYVYATEGAVPLHYDAAMMDMAWKVKKS